MNKLKETLLDVKARDQEGREFIIEMQVEKQQHFTKRTTYYTSKAYAGQLKASEDYLNLKPVIFLGVLDFNIFNDNEPITCHLILNKRNQAHEIKELSFNFIELPKFNKTEAELETLTDQWLFFLKNAPSLEMMPTSVQTKGLKTAYEVAEQHNWTADELEAYEYWGIRHTGHLDALETARVEGKAEEKFLMSSKMLKEGFEAKVIQNITGLALHEIEKIKQSLQK